MVLPVDRPPRNAQDNSTPPRTAIPKQCVLLKDQDPIISREPEPSEPQDPPSFRLCASIYKHYEYWYHYISTAVPLPKEVDARLYT